MMITEKHLTDVMAWIDRRIERQEVAKTRHATEARESNVPSIYSHLRGKKWHTQQMYCSMREVAALRWVKKLLEEPDYAARTPQGIQKKADELADSLRGIFPSSTVKGYSSIEDVLEERGM